MNKSEYARLEQISRSILSLYEALRSLKESSLASRELRAILDDLYEELYSRNVGAGADIMSAAHNKFAIDKYKDGNWLYRKLWGEPLEKRVKMQAYLQNMRERQNPYFYDEVPF